MFMLQKKIIKLATKSSCNSVDGFSLIESAIALVTLAICLAYAMPMFLYAKVNNTKSEIRTGALIVAQREFDNVRSQSITDLPSNDGRNSPNSTNPISVPVNLASITPAEKLRTYAMGRQYQTTVTYCEDVSTVDPTACNNEYRKFKVEVNYNGTKVYDLEGTYTSFN
jgi:type II secretory pathway pseudopilin PulG